jgi:hypothetical protein
MAEAFMDPMEINDQRSLRAWLSDKPGEWAQSIALRAALRALPYIGVSRDSWLENFALLPFGAVLTSWVQLTESSIDIFVGSRANARFSGESFDFAGYKDSPIAATAANASYHSADAQTQSVHVFSDCVEAVKKADAAFRSVEEKREDWGEDDGQTLNMFWYQIQNDCGGFESRSMSNALDFLANSPVWSNSSLYRQSLPNWSADWQKLSERLRSIDPNYSVWIDWYERRLRGERAAFDIPGDKGRVEDKKILRRLAEATDEDFWGKGHEYVNAALKGWLDEARARVAPPPIVAEASSTLEFTLSAHAEVGPLPTPPQDPSAISYGVNEQGKLDRLPNSDQVHLRDVPDQRRSYNDLREATAELLAEGQRLGHRLTKALDRFLQSLPERFEDAEAYLVWRDANALRRLHRAHREAAKTPEPDEAKLEPVIAEGLGGLLDLYNNFAFADDGLRAKDEARISPQERAVAEEEAAAAVPLIEAILATPDISTPHARNDIAIEAENIHFPTNDPYTAQALAQSNRTISNYVAGLLSGVKEAASNPKTVGYALTLGSIGKVGEVATETILSANYAPLFEFIATNGPALQSYAAIAFASFPHLPDLIASIGAIWNSFKNRGSQ